MIVKQIWTANRMRNFNYLVACEQTGEALAIDPCDVEKCLSVAHQNEWRIHQILNTHEHHDHIAGNKQMLRMTGATLLAPRDAADRIPHVDVALTAGDQVSVGESVQLRVLDTPGHTMSHICLMTAAGPPVLFSGDTLFNAGTGHCRMGGDPETLFQTLQTQIAPLPDETQVYPGHDYLINNLRFTLDREPDNQRAAELLNELGEDYVPDPPFVTTIGLERQINVFLRLESNTVISGLRETYPDRARNPDPREVFLMLRELRNDW